MADPGNAAQLASNVDIEHAFDSAAAAVRATRDVIVATGSEAADYLHGQLSQDVVGLAVAASAPTLLLQPQGKVEVWGRLSRLEPELFWLDVDVGYGPQALERLQRFKLRVDCDFVLNQVEMVAVRGPAAVDGPGGLGFVVADTAVVLDACWPGLAGFDVFGSDVEIPSGVLEGSAAALDALRIRLGIPAMGSELTSSTIPNAAGIVAQSVDFTKGCYVGQELVARINSRGNNTPTHLRGVRFRAGVEVDVGAQIMVGDKEAGVLTSYASSSAVGPVGLAYIKRSITVPSQATIVDRQGQPAEIELVVTGSASANSGQES